MRNNKEWYSPCVICGASIRNVGSQRPRTACSELCRKERKLRCAKEHYERKHGHKRLVAQIRGARTESPQEKTRRHQAIIGQEKLARGSCLDCGLEVTVETVTDFDFDHRDRSTKRATVSTLSNRGNLERIIEEMAKCDLRCAICHRRKTIRERDFSTGKITNSTPNPCLFELESCVSE
jgi:hypothetical protein